MSVFRAGGTVCGTIALVVALLVAPTGAATAPAITEAPEATAALAAARQAGTPVEVTGLRTETGRVLANPSGSMTLEQYALPVRTRKDGRWVAIDTALARQPDGSVRPEAAAVDLRLSRGGTDPLLTMSKDGKGLTLAWPDPLPRPELAGDTATYPEVLPGVDLRVRAEPAGFFQALVVKSAAAARNPALHRIRYRLATTGLTVRATPDGASVAVDAHGTVVFAAPEPSMWDNAAKRATLGLELRPDELAVLPDQALLSAPDTSYPVTIDPSYSAPQYRWAPVFLDMPNTSFWTEDELQVRDYARVGYQNWSSDATQGVWRSLFQVNTAPIAGARVLRTWFSITLDHSASCNATPVDLYHGPPIDPAKPLTWNSSAGTFASANRLAQRSGNANESGGCGTAQPDQNMEFGSTALTTLVQATADARTNSLAFGLRAGNENDRYQWKKFHQGTAKLVVEYNTPPRAPTGLSTVPPTGCGTATAPVALNTATPTFSAVASDPDVDNVGTDLEILSDGTVLTTVRSATVGSGSAFTWPPLPAGVLPANDPAAVFSYRARSRDSGGLAGAYGVQCYFTVDQVRPGVPTISSTDYPHGTAVRLIAQPGLVTFTKAAANTDVAGFRYGFSPDRITMWVAARPDGTASVPITLWPTVPNTTIGIDRDLYVQAVDRAGNVSAATPAWRLTATGRTVTAPPARGDFNGDRRPDVTAIVDHGDGRTAVWSLLARSSGFFTGYIAWDSGVSGGFPGYRIRSATGDFDGDGRTDRAILREDPDQQVRLYLLRSDGNRLDAFSEPMWTGTGYRLNQLSIAAADIDADGDDDLLALQAMAGSHTKVYTHLAADGRLGPPVLQWDSGAGFFNGERARVVGGDFDADGDGDAAVFQPLPDGQTRLHVLVSDRTRLAAPVQRWNNSADDFAGERAAYAVADVDGDAVGRDEIVAKYDLGNGATRLVVFTPGAGTAHWTTASWWDSGAAGSYDANRATLVTGDFTADGRTDVAMLYDTGAGNRRLDTFVSTGTGFAAPRVDWTGYVADTAPAVYLEPGRRYRLIARHSGKCAEIQSGRTANGEPLRQWDCTAAATNQQFLLERIGATQFVTFKVVATAKCVDVSGWSQADNAKVQQYTCGTSVPQSNQEFEPRYVAGSGLDVVVRLVAAHSGKCLAISGASATSGTAVVQLGCGAIQQGGEFYLRPAP